VRGMTVAAPDLYDERHFWIGAFHEIRCVGAPDRARSSLTPGQLRVVGKLASRLGSATGGSDEVDSEARP
jgi:hypothetical protein